MGTFNKMKLLVNIILLVLIVIAIFCLIQLGYNWFTGVWI